jgi:hypothetical protein
MGAVDSPGAGERRGMGREPPGYRVSMRGIDSSVSATRCPTAPSGRLIVDQCRPGSSQTQYLRGSQIPLATPTGSLRATGLGWTTGADRQVCAAVRRIRGPPSVVGQLARSGLRRRSAELPSMPAPGESPVKPVRRSHIGPSLFCTRARQCRRRMDQAPRGPNVPVRTRGRCARLDRRSQEHREGRADRVRGFKPAAQRFAGRDHDLRCSAAFSNRRALFQSRSTARSVIPSVSAISASV